MRKPRVKSEKADIDIAYMRNTPHVPLRQNAEEEKRGKEVKVV